jgi:hypothetical protein
MNDLGKDLERHKENVQLLVFKNKECFKFINIFSTYELLWFSTGQGQQGGPL